MVSKTKQCAKQHFEPQFGSHKIGGLTSWGMGALRSLIFVEQSREQIHNKKRLIVSARW